MHILIVGYDTFGIWRAASLHIVPAGASCASATSTDKHILLVSCFVSSFVVKVFSVNSVGACTATPGCWWLQDEHMEESDEDGDQDMEDGEEEGDEEQGDDDDDDEQEEGSDADDNEEEEGLFADLRRKVNEGEEEEGSEDEGADVQCETGQHDEVGEDGEDEGLDVQDEAGVDAEMEVDDESEQDGQDEGNIKAH